MVESIYGRYGAKMVTCDGCGDGFESEDWNQARNRLKEDGWKTTIEDGTTLHYCPDCANI